jgi:hypothetical protein
MSKDNKARDALKELGISLDKTINWTKAPKEQMNVIACTRSKNSSVENIEGDEDRVYIPVCGEIEVKTFLEVNREEMEMMWTTEKVEGAEDAYTTLYMKHIPFGGTAEIAWTIELLRDLVSPYYLVRLGRMRGTLDSMSMTTEQMQAAFILQPVFAEVSNLLVCKHFPHLILSQYNKAITVPKIGELPQSKQQHTVP